MQQGNRSSEGNSDHGLGWSGKPPGKELRILLIILGFEVDFQKASKS